jgi:mRNA interferase RelE/StbE
MYKIIYEKAAIQKLAKMPPKTASLIQKKIKQVAEEPYDPNNNIIIKLVSQDQSYRLRVGDWRVIYKIDNGELKILVLDIGPRGGIYKK